MAQRFSCNEFVPDDAGDFVFYVDYARLEDENAELREAINRMEIENVERG
jgi:hypothetical protein